MSTSVSLPAATSFPVYFKLQQTGGNVSAYYSLDGSQYTQLGTQQPLLALGNGSAIIGLVATSNLPSGLSTAVFGDVKSSAIFIPIQLPRLYNWWWWLIWSPVAIAVISIIASLAYRLGWFSSLSSSDDETV